MGFLIGMGLWRQLPCRGDGCMVAVIRMGPEAPCRGAGTVPPFPGAPSAGHGPGFCGPSPAVVASPCGWDVLGWDVEQLIISCFASRLWIFRSFGAVAGVGLRDLACAWHWGPLTQGDIYRAVPAVARDLGFSGLARVAAPFGRLLRRAGGSGDLF